MAEFLQEKFYLKFKSCKFITKELFLELECLILVNYNLIKDI